MAESKSAALPLGYAPTGIAFYAQPRGVSRRANPSPTGERGVNIGAKSNTSMAPLASTFINGRLQELGPPTPTHHLRHRDGPETTAGSGIRFGRASARPSPVVRSALISPPVPILLLQPSIAWPGLFNAPFPDAALGPPIVPPSCRKTRRRPWLSPRAPGSAALGVNAMASARANRLAAGAHPCFFPTSPQQLRPCGGRPMPSAGLTAISLRGCRRCGGPNLPRIRLQLRPEPGHWPIFRGPGRRCCQDRAERAPIAVAA